MKPILKNFILWYSLQKKDKLSNQENIELNQSDMELHALISSIQT